MINCSFVIYEQIQLLKVSYERRDLEQFLKTSKMSEVTYPYRCLISILEQENDECQTAFQATAPLSISTLARIEFVSTTQAGNLDPLATEETEEQSKYCNRPKETSAYKRFSNTEPLRIC